MCSLKLPRMSWVRYWSYSFFLYAVFKVHVDRLFYQSLETWTVSEVFHELTVKVVLKPCFRTSSFNFKSLITGKTSYQNSTALLIGLALISCCSSLPVSMIQDPACSLILPMPSVVWCPGASLQKVRSPKASPVHSLFRSLQVWQPPALPHRLQCSTIGRLGLNHRVRDGYGCFP